MTWPTRAEAAAGGEYWSVGVLTAPVHTSWGLTIPALQAVTAWAGHAAGREPREVGLAATLKGAGPGVRGWPAAGHADTNWREVTVAGTALPPVALLSVLCCALLCFVLLLRCTLDILAAANSILI